MRKAKFTNLAPNPRPKAGKPHLKSTVGSEICEAFSPGTTSFDGSGFGMSVRIDAHVGGRKTKRGKRGVDYGRPYFGMRG